MARVVVGAGLAALATANMLECRSHRSASEDAGPPADAAAPTLTEDAGRDAQAESGDGSAEVGLGDGGESTPVGTSEGCPDDMLLIHGSYCPGLEQNCVFYHPEYEKDKERKKHERARGDEVDPSTVSERCMKYEEPSQCLSKHRSMRFCIDRYEWPNKKGELPRFLVSWRDAKKLCESVGKRLCTEDEFNFACEGEQMLPYTYGFSRDKTKCNIDRPYRMRQRTLRRYDNCMKDAKCKAEIERLDQRVPSGSMPGCVSPFGVYDLNGNLNEWIVRPGKKYPDRSGLKGGWWGPVRSRCRPTVAFHKEEDYGYEEGFRCCKDAASP